MKDPDCVDLLRWALPRLRMRWAGFRKVRRQVCRRIDQRIRELGVAGPGAYRRTLETRPEEWTVLDRLCRVTISRFHRDREVFRRLEEDVLPGMAALRGEPDGRLRVWSAGCASGEEPYSVALLWRLRLEAAFPEVELEVLGTDVDPHLLVRARRACYAASTLKELPRDWVEKAFRERRGFLCLGAEYRRGVRFRRADVRRTLPRGLWDLALCRNLVFTYYDEALQGEVLARILSRLSRGGALVLGGHEELPPGSWPLRRPWAGVPIFLAQEA